MALGIGATVTPRAGRVAPSRPGDHGGYPAVAPLVIYLTCIMKGIKIMRTIKQGFSRYVAGGLVAMLLVQNIYVLPDGGNRPHCIIRDKVFLRKIWPMAHETNLIPIGVDQSYIIFPERVLPPTR